jgi:ABC-type sugar transport system ATPase subunit
MVIGNLCFHEGQWSRPNRMEAFCRPFLDQVGLTVSIRQPATSLSIAQRQLLAIARALSMNARLLLMDEPTSSLFDDNVDRLFGLIRDLRARGVSVIYVSHKMDEIFRISDRVTVMRDGETVGTRETPTTNSAELIRMMVGRDLDTTPNPPRQIPNEAILEFENVTTKRLRGVSFSLHRGEVLGIAGLVGAGRSGVGAALFGIDRTVSGTLRLNGALFAPRSPREAMRHGVGLVPEDRRVEGLMMSMTVLENASFAAPGSAQTRTQFAEVARQLALQSPSDYTCVSHLSGGNQQKVLLARWLLLQPGVLFLDDPTRGIDVAAKHDIYRLIAQLSANGRAVILVSSELPELLRCCHRIVVLREGRVTGVFDAAAATQEKIMAAATLAEAHA